MILEQTLGPVDQQGTYLNASIWAYVVGILAVEQTVTHVTLEVAVTLPTATVANEGPQTVTHVTLGVEVTFNTQSIYNWSPMIRTPILGSGRTLTIEGTGEYA